MVKGKGRNFKKKEINREVGLKVVELEF